MPVYKDDKTGTFYAKFYYQDYTGQRKQKLKRGFKLQREAKEWERQFLERQQGTPSMSFQSLYNVYIEDISHRLRQSSINGKINVFKNRILPYFKDKPVNEITPADIRAWQNDQLTAGYSEGYLCRINTTLSTIFNYAVKYYGLTSNPCTKAGYIGKHTRSLNFWTVDQYNQFMASLDNDRARMAIELLFYGGMRIGELLALTPADIDHENNMISINKTYHETEGGYISPPKTNNSTFIIVPIMSYPISLPDLNNSKNVTSGFFSTISLKDAAMATATSMIAPSPEIRISAWKISSGFSILPRYSMIE